MSSKSVNTRKLTVNNVPITDMALTNGNAVNTDAIDMRRNVGFSTLVATVDAAGDVDITAQYSLDGENWGIAGLSDMQGTVTDDGNIITGLSNVTRKHIVIDARLCNYMRFVLDPDADSTITLDHLMQEEY